MSTKCDSSGWSSLLLEIPQKAESRLLTRANASQEKREWPWRQCAQLRVRSLPFRLTVDADAERNPWLRMRHASGDEYDAPYERRATAGDNVHGEADFVMRFAPTSVLDAGCGTGRVARELARRGVETVGVDLDDEMLSTARRKAPALDWHRADLATIDLGRVFDVVLLAGNVMIFLTPGTERTIVANIARHMAREGLLIAGFSLRPGQLGVEEYDSLAASAGLSLVERWATWAREAWAPGADYQVSIHRRPPRSAPIEGPAT